MEIKNTFISVSKKVIATQIFKNFMRDLGSLRALWCWLFLALFFVSYSYIVYVNPKSHDTALVVLGGMVSWIFSNYVISKSWEKTKGVDMETEEKLIQLHKKYQTSDTRESREGA